MAEFKFTLHTMWSNNGKITKIDQEDSTILPESVRVSGIVSNETINILITH